MLTGLRFSDGFTGRSRKQARTGPVKMARPVNFLWEACKPHFYFSGDKSPSRRHRFAASVATGTEPRCRARVAGGVAEAGSAASSRPQRCCGACEAARRRGRQAPPRPPLAPHAHDTGALFRWLCSPQNYAGGKAICRRRSGNTAKDKSISSRHLKTWTCKLSLQFAECVGYGPKTAAAEQKRQMNL